MQWALILQEGSAMCERGHENSVFLRGKKVLVGCDSTEISIGRMYFSIWGITASRNLLVRMQQEAFTDF